LHADKWASFLPGAHVVAMPDSGFFLDYQGKPALRREEHGLNDIGPGVYRTDMQWVFYYMNATSGVCRQCSRCNCVFVAIGYLVVSRVLFVVVRPAGVHPSCIAAYPEDQQWMCMFAEHTGKACAVMILATDWHVLRFCSALHPNADIPTPEPVRPLAN
jgi:hypothetical protein